MKAKAQFQWRPAPALSAPNVVAGVKKLALVPVLALVLAAGSAWAEVTIGVSVSATGPAASLGIPEKNTFALLPPTIHLHAGLLQPCVHTIRLAYVCAYVFPAVALFHRSDPSPV